MEAIPAIDLMGGRCVQLVGGDPATKKDFGNPFDRIRQFVKAGASTIHVIDLDATLGLGSNLDTVKSLIDDVDADFEFGGGIRSVDAAKQVLETLGKRCKVILGTLAVSDYPGFEALKQLRIYRRRLIVSVDSKGGYVAVNGWQKKSTITPHQLMEKTRDLCWGYLFTNVDVEGKMQGIDTDYMREVVGSTEKPVIVSGGISSQKDLEALEESNAWGAVIGKALYEGVLNIEEIF